MTKIQKLFLTIALSILAVATVQAFDYSKLRTAKDGYVFERKEWEMTEFTIRVVALKNQEEFDEAKKQVVKSRAKRKKLAAFAMVHPARNSCVIYVPDPSWKYEPEYIGHELTHCIWGRWHPRQN